MEEEIEVVEVVAEVIEEGQVLIKEKGQHQGANLVLACKNLKAVKIHRVNLTTHKAPTGLATNKTISSLSTPRNNNNTNSSKATSLSNLEAINSLNKIRFSASMA